MRVGKNIQWLIKSSGRIMGPYSDKQIGDLLREKLIVPLDEVARSSGRWVYLRDEPTFAKIIEEIRVRNLRGMSDDTTTHANDDMGFTRTATITPQQSDELTQEISTSSSPATVQDILFQSIDDPIQSRKSEPSSEHYTHEGDLFIKHQVKETTRWVWAVTAVVLMVTVSFVIFRQYVAKPIQNKSMADESTTAGIEALDEGDYKKALNLFNRAYQIDPANMSIYTYLGILKIQVEDQPYQGRMLLEKLRGREDRDLKRVLTGIGLAYLKEGQFKSAENYFNKALDADPEFNFAIINLGAVAISQGDWARAVNHLLLSVKEGSLDGAEILMLVEAYLGLFEKEKDKRYLQEADKILKEALPKAQAYRQELLLAKTYLEMLVGNQAKLATYSSIDKILDMDPFETDQHKHHIFIYRDKTHWNVLAQWCLKLTEDLDPVSHVVALEAYCLYRAGGWADANRKIDDAVNQTPRDPLVLSIQAYILYDMNSLERAEVIVEKALSFDQNQQFIQPRRLKGYICQRTVRKDCEQEMWPMVLKMDPLSLAGLAGQARLLIADKNIKEAKKFLLKGLKHSPRYMPFYSINKTISQAEDLEKSKGL